MLYALGSVVAVETIVLIILLLKYAAAQATAKNHSVQIQQLTENHAREMEAKIAADNMLMQQQKDNAAAIALHQREEASNALIAQRDSYERALKERDEACEKRLVQQRQDFEKTHAALEERWKKELTTLREEFQNSAGRMLEERTEKLDASNQKQMKDLFDPFKEKLKELQGQLETSQKERASLGSAMKLQLEDVQKHAERMVLETDKLTNALRSTNKMQGNWGELQLEKALEDCGLEKGVHFLLQCSITDNTGKTFVGPQKETYIPDATVCFPNGRRIFIDSKMSMTAYMAYLDATDDASRKAALDAHMTSVKNHIKTLSTKSYPNAGNTAIPNSSFENTIMFMGNEGALTLALSTDPNLWEDAFRRHKVILVSRMSLYPLLWLINRSWQIERQSQNQAKILENTHQLIERLESYAKDYAAIGTKITALKDAYDKNLRFLRDSNKGVLKTGNRLAALMGKETKNINSLLDDDSDEMHNATQQETIGLPPAECTT
ncbi:MAG: DNA recombination protein RmuC [Lentisphaeria bacterium]|nr:DNA recombination protein RmuC [Lentisphaeria bacterium]